MQQPLFDTHDGTTSDRLVRSTTLKDLVLTGTIPREAVDVQVDIGGEGFISDPDLVSFEGDEFTVPNTNVMPEGLRLASGENVIRIRAVLPTGNVTAAAEARVTALSQSEVDLTIEPPTGLRVRRRTDAVELVWSHSESPYISGYHVWASTEPAGGAEGYRRVNADLITEVAFQEETRTEIAETSATYDVVPNSRLRATLIEEDAFGAPIKTVSDGTLGTETVGEAVATTTVEAINRVQYHSFVHDRRDGVDQGILNSEFWRAVSPDKPMYYVVTAIGLDPDNGVEVESVRSAEMVGLPLVIDSRVADIQPPKRFEIARNVVDDILSTDRDVSAVPGSVTRDVHIDPFSSEAERLYFLADFVRRTQTFSTLLLVDDPDGDGESDLVSESSYKQALKSALGIREDNDVQALIDDAFDKLAGNHERVRRGAEPAIGQAVFYTETEPAVDMVVEEGTIVATAPEEGTAARFRVTSRVVLPFDQRQSYYDFQRDRWEVKANIEALNPGELGNVPANRIKTVQAGTNLSVINLEPTDFGRDEESNRELAERAILAFSSVDSGTGPGYRAEALEQSGVFRTRVVKGEDPLMMRDWDDVRDKHVGGKVDVWVQGRREVVTTERFALTFRRATNVDFVLDSAPTDLVFVVDDDRLSAENPISQILGQTPTEQAQGFGVRNVTTGQSFDLTGYDIVGYNRIALDTNIAQPNLSVNDRVVGDIRFLRSARHVLERQPLTSFDQMVRVATGDVLERDIDYEIVDDADPLLLGGSVRSDARVHLLTGGGLDDLETVVVNDERHVLVGQISDELGNLGVVPSSVRVFSLDRSVEYEGPRSTTPDFFLREGGPNTPSTLERNPNGNIANGEQVSVDYQHDENFEATYAVDKLVESVQASINESKHAAADTLVKRAVPVGLVFEMTVVLRRDAEQSQVDSKLRTSLGQMLNTQESGRAVRQSDVVRVVENTEGVDHVKMPLARMAHADGALVLRETVASEFEEVESTGSLRIYVAKDRLNNPTIDGGGVENTHRGVFVDDRRIQDANNFADLFNGAWKALVVGDEGVIIPGYSDDPTLLSEGFGNDETSEERLDRTANRIFVAVPERETPSDHDWTVTYQVFNQRGSRDIEVSDVSFAQLSDLTLTYRTSD